MGRVEQYVVLQQVNSYGKEYYVIRIVDIAELEIRIYECRDKMYAHNQFVRTFSNFVLPLYAV